jgi:hypothetical protein
VVPQPTPSYVEQAKEYFKDREPIYFHFLCSGANLQPLVPVCFYYSDPTEEEVFYEQDLYAMFDTGDPLWSTKLRVRPSTSLVIRN